MAKKKTFSEAEKAALRRAGLKWAMWAPLQQLPNSMIVKNIFTGEVKVIDKLQIPS